MSDDDSESDIETMFQDAHNNIARKIDERVDLDSDVSDNDEKDKKNAAQLATHQNNPSYNYSIKKRKANASDTKQQHLLQLKAKQEQIDKLYSSKLQRITNEDDDDDDFLDDDDVKVVGTSTAAATTSTTTSTTTTGVHNGMTTRSGTTTTTTTSSTNTTKPPNYIDPAITLLDSDGDDDDVPATIHSRNIATTTASISTTGSTTNHRMMHHPNLSSVPSLHPQNNSNVMNSLYAAMIQGQVVPGMIIPPSSINMMMNQQVQQSQAISLQQQYLQHIQQQRLQSAVANLKNPTIISIDEMVTPNQNSIGSSSNSSLLRIKVIATIIPNQGSSIPISTLADLPIVDLTSDESTQQQHSSVFTQIKGSRTVSCVVDIIETSTIQILMDRILEHYLKLNLKQNVIGLRYNNEPMYPKHTLDMYRIPISGATIAATVQSSDTIHNNNNNNTNHHGKLVNASSFAAAKPKPYVPKGIVIHLLLRRSIMNNNNNGKVTSEEISMSIGNLDPLQILVDQYRQKHCNNNNGTTKNNKITLQFDGDTLILERTPKQYDMESDDLIDVIVS